jgi:hypothetical protein
VVRPVGDHCDAGAYENEDIVSFSGELPEAEPFGPTTCRFGPGAIYAPINFLNEGQTVQLISRNEEASWLEVKSKDGQVGPCWVDTDLLEIPPAVTLPALELGYIPPEPTLTPTPEPESSGGGGKTGCLWYDAQQNVVCFAQCPVKPENSLGSCKP